MINGNKISLSDPLNSANTTSTQAVPATSQKAVSTLPTHTVTIVYDTIKHKLRAVANDGIHGYANVAFPNNLRTHDGQQYEVDALVWNGKNYRVSGNIKAI